MFVMQMYLGQIVLLELKEFLNIYIKIYSVASIEKKNGFKNTVAN